MNEKLIVRNFGPITEAEVEFKRVTVFIGPTGGGKSTLAKLAAIFRDTKLLLAVEEVERQNSLENLIEKFDLSNFVENESHVKIIKNDKIQVELHGRLVTVIAEEMPPIVTVDRHIDVKVPGPLQGGSKEQEAANTAAIFNAFVAALSEDEKVVFSTRMAKVLSKTVYLPADRVFAASAQNALAGLQANNIALSKALLEFLAEFEVARKKLSEMPLPFFGVSYQYVNGLNQIKISNGKILPLSESASGLQSAVPLLLLLEYKFLERKSRGMGANYSIVEEPELNLFPAAQKHIIEKIIKLCTLNKDELIINTHSPYILSHLNLLLYAHQVATQYPDRADEVAKLVPRESWIDPTEFAAYYVGEGGVRSIVDEELGLIDNNELDNIAGDQADAFDNLIRLSKGFAVK